MRERKSKDPPSPQKARREGWGNLTLRFDMWDAGKEVKGPTLSPQKARREGWGNLGGGMTGSHLMVISIMAVLTGDF